MSLDLLPFIFAQNPFSFAIMDFFSCDFTDAALATERGKLF